MTRQILQISLSTWQGFCVSQAHEQPSLPSSVKVPSVKLKPGTEDVKQLVLDKSNCQGKSLATRLERFERFTFGSVFVRWVGGGLKKPTKRWTGPVVDLFFFLLVLGENFQFWKKTTRKSRSIKIRGELEANRSREKGGKVSAMRQKTSKKIIHHGLAPRPVSGQEGALRCRKGRWAFRMQSLDFGKSPKGYRVTFQHVPTPSKSPFTRQLGFLINRGGDHRDPVNSIHLGWSLYQPPPAGGVQTSGNQGGQG